MKQRQKRDSERLLQKLKAMDDRLLFKKEQQRLKSESKQLNFEIEKRKQEFKRLLLLDKIKEVQAKKRRCPINNLNLSKVNFGSSKVREIAKFILEHFHKYLLSFTF